MHFALLALVARWALLAIAPSWRSWACHPGRRAISSTTGSIACSHEVRFLWAAHVNHHSSQRYNLSTALRQSWTTPFTSLLFWWPLALLGFPPAMILATIAINTLYQFWIHTELIGRVGPLEHVLNTASHHRVHHGVNLEYLDRNHGGMFIVWDKLFGTFEPERAQSPLWSDHEHRELRSVADRDARMDRPVRATYGAPRTWRDPPRLRLRRARLEPRRLDAHRPPAAAAGEPRAGAGRLGSFWLAVRRRVSGSAGAQCPSPLRAGVGAHPSRTESSNGSLRRGRQAR